MERVRRERGGREGEREGGCEKREQEGVYKRGRRMEGVGREGVREEGFTIRLKMHVQ